MFDKTQYTFNNQFVFQKTKIYKKKYILSSQIVVV